MSNTNSAKETTKSEGVKVFACTPEQALESYESFMKELGYTEMLSASTGRDGQAQEADFSEVRGKTFPRIFSQAEEGKAGEGSKGN